MHQRHNQQYGGLPPDEAALHWISRRMSGSMNPDERRDFEIWLAAAPANRAAFAVAEALLLQADLAGEDLLARDSEGQLHAEAAKRASSNWRLASLAATMAVITVGAVMTLFGPDVRPRAPFAYETGIGQSQVVDLADGSRIELNTASRVEVDYTRSARAIELAEGEVFFDVEKDLARPFIVGTKYADIFVTGTSFSIAAFEDRSSVHVLTGVVEVAPRRGAQATLLAGDTIEIGADGRTGGVMRYDPSLVFAWRSGKARFREEPLGDVIMSLNRYFETPIVLGDQSLADLPVTGEFDIRDRGLAIDALKLIFNLASADEPARTILNRTEGQ